MLDKSSKKLVAHCARETELSNPVVFRGRRRGGMGGQLPLLPFDRWGKGGQSYMAAVFYWRTVTQTGYIKKHS